MAVVFGRSIPVHILRSPGTAEEKRWSTLMGGDLSSKALFQPEDRVQRGDEIHAENFFDEPRIVTSVYPQVVMDGSISHWEARIQPKSEWGRENNTRRVQSQPILVFVSHSSKDHEVAERLTQLLRVALRLPATSIRCTSVEGHRLPGGAKTDQQLKQEIRDARVFIGIISPRSVTSIYMLFELGARWGADKHFLPLLAPGVSAGDLVDPIKNINALACDNVAQVHQMLQELGSELGIALEAPQSYQRQLHELVETVPLASEMAANATGPFTTAAAGHPVTTSTADIAPISSLGRVSTKDRVLLKTLGADALDLLTTAAAHPDGAAFVIETSHGVSIAVGSREFAEVGVARSEARWKRALQALVEAKLMEVEDVRRNVTHEGFRLAELADRR